MQDVGPLLNQVYPEMNSHTPKTATVDIFQCGQFMIKRWMFFSSSIFGQTQHDSDNFCYILFILGIQRMVISDIRRPPQDMMQIAKSMNALYRCELSTSLGWWKAQTSSILRWLFFRPSRWMCTFFGVLGKVFWTTYQKSPLDASNFGNQFQMFGVHTRPLCGSCRQWSSKLNDGCKDERHTVKQCKNMQESDACRSIFGERLSIFG